MESIAVIGASLAGLRATEALRREGFEGELHLVGDEGELPYDRPPLSKKVLDGERNVEETGLVTNEALDDLNVTRHLNDTAVSLDSATLVVTLGSGRELDVDGVIIATGARARTIPTELDGVYALRTMADSAAIAAAFDAAPSRVVIVGAGFIGAEVAAAARGRGLDVTLVEMANAPFERVLGAEVGQVVADIHSEHGVDLRTGVGQRAFHGDGSIEAVELTDGSSIDADLVVVGVGAIPNAEWLEGSGLTIDDGVQCDETLSAAPGVVAIGDVANWYNPRFDARMRVEHWENAIISGQHGAKRLLHGEAAGAYDPVPWFWSDQYDHKLQLAGRTAGYNSFEIVEGDVESRRFVALYGRDGVFTGVFGMSRPRHVIKYRQLIAAGATWAEALAAEI